MKTITRNTYVVMVASMLLLTGITPISVAYADKPTEAGGEWTNTTTSLIPLRFPDGQIILYATQVGEFTEGTIEGSFTDEIWIVLHRNGEFNYWGTLTCECTVDGKSGTLVFRAQGGGTLAGFQHTTVILSGTGELKNLHGTFYNEGSVVGQDPDTGLDIHEGTYSGRIHFDNR